MNINVFITTEGKTNLSATAYSKNMATIFISAETLEAAAALIPQGERLALDAMENWQPKEDPAKPVKENAAEAQELDAAKEARIAHQIETATAFRRRKSEGMTLSEMNYLVRQEKIDTVMQAYDLGYRRGWNAQKRKNN